MKPDINKARRIEIFVDENKDLAIFSFIKNPDFVYNLEPTSAPPDFEIPPVFRSKTAFELYYPYTIEELAEVIQKGIDAWNKLEPYISKRKSIEEYYYKINGFKKATLGKKMIQAGWDGFGKKDVVIFLPAKVGKYYLGMKTIKLPDDAGWMDFANAVMELIEMDITQCGPYKAYKRNLNI